MQEKAWDLRESQRRWWWSKH